MGFFLGIDVGTQSIKGILIDPLSGKFSAPVAVNYGKELEKYGSPDGFLPSKDPALRHADPLMWLDALDMLLGKMQKIGLPMEQVCGISGSGQQHGTVYLNEYFTEALAALKPEYTLAQQLASSLSRKTAPIWMDASSSIQCAKLQEKFKHSLKSKTGSNAAERFSGPQIMKFAMEQEEEWNKTVHIHLVSSFMASVLAGKPMPIDYGDGAGMNLLNLNTLAWDQEIVAFTAPDLEKKLPHCTASTCVAGKLAPYFAKYGLRPGIGVNVWSGDNPNSLIGCGCVDNTSAMISLGTSDTFSGIVENFADAPKKNGHIFGCPSGGFMSLICFTNGSLTRDHFRKKYALSYEEFDTAASAAAPGKYQMLPFLTAESTPQLSKPAMFYNFDHNQVTAGEFIRALIESQLLNMLYHAELTRKPAQIRLTGGASASTLLRQMIADIFQTPVMVGASAETAALGSAMRAANSIGGISFEKLTERFCKVEKIIYPNAALEDKYIMALQNFAQLLHAHYRN